MAIDRNQRKLTAGLAHSSPTYPPLHGWAHLSATTLLATLALVISACQGLRPLADVEREQSDWLCQGTATGDGWDCTAEGDEIADASPPSAVAAPRPEQMPAPSQPSPEAQPTPENKPNVADAAPQAPVAVAPQPTAPQSEPETPPAPAVSRQNETPTKEQPPEAPEATARDSAETAAPPQPQRPVPAPRPAPAAPTSSADLPLYRQLAHSGDAQADLLTLPANFYALQLLAMSSQEALDSFAAEQGLRQTISTRVARDGNVFYVLLAGIYADQDAAERALASLPPAVQALPPWIRPLGLLQRAMRQAGGG